MSSCNECASNNSSSNQTHSRDWLRFTTYSGQLEKSALNYPCRRHDAGRLHRYLPRMDAEDLEHRDTNAISCQNASCQGSQHRADQHNRRRHKLLLIQTLTASQDTPQQSFNIAIVTNLAAITISRRQPLLLFRIHLSHFGLPPGPAPASTANAVS